VNNTKAIRHLHNLYAYLITNRFHSVSGWLQNYRVFAADVARIRDALNRAIDIRHKDAYAGTAWADKGSPWEAFAREFLQADNGVTSRGQSVLSHANFDIFIKDDEFVGCVADVIKSPGQQQFYALRAKWDALCAALNANRNQMLVNRVLAACTQEVCSTVNVDNLNTVYTWLGRHGMLGANSERQETWYQQNIQLMRQLHVAFEDVPAEERPDAFLLSVFVWELYEYIGTRHTPKKQVVKYGAPGTGKTYTARAQAQWQFTLWQHEFGEVTGRPFEECCETVQFHPSFGYEDFMEGLRPVLREGQAHLTLVNGVFKRLCKAAGIWEQDVYAIPEIGPALATDWPNLTIAQLAPHARHLQGEHWKFLLAHPDQDSRLIEAVPPYFIIIDEINRAELSRVMGELMYSLEYRGTSGAISTQYATLNDESTGMIKVAGQYRFFVPHNVHVIGTMNTIDRSVESFDLALRRRFRWERVNPSISVLRHDLKQKAPQWEKLADNLASLNEEITRTQALGADYQIGQAYLMKLAYAPGLGIERVRERIWDDSLAPLLEEYLRGLGHAADTLNKLRKAFGLAAA